jgi:hypothetical protein
MMMLALISALTLTVAVVTTNNLVSARLSQQAGSALNASDAGIAQAMAYLRQGGIRDFRICGTTCANVPWGTANPKTVTINGRAGQAYTVSIRVTAPYTAVKPGTLEIRSTGTAAGAARRTVAVDVAVEPIPMTFGVVAESFDAVGNAGVHNESVFSTGCVTKRDHLAVTGFDSAYRVPAGVRTPDIISNGNGCSDSSSIHAGNPCSTAFPYDEDKRGGPLGSSTCADKAHTDYPTQPQFTTPTDPLYKYPQTSISTDPTSIFSKYRPRRPPFTQAQLDQLKAIAISQNNYYTSASGWSAPTATDSVLYFDLTATNPGADVNLNGLDAPPWDRPINLAASDSNCPSRSLLVIIEGGDASINSNSQVAGSIFLISDGLYGNFTKLNGGAALTGNIFANNIRQNGTSDMYLDGCFLANVSPALTTVRTLNYRELDR